MKENALEIRIREQKEERDFVKNPPSPSIDRSMSTKDISSLIREILDKGFFFIQNDGGTVYRHMKDQKGIVFREITTGVAVSIERTFLISHFREAREDEIQGNLIWHFLKKSRETNNSYEGIRAEDFDKFEIDINGPEVALRGIKGKLIMIVYLNGEWAKPDLFVNTKTFFGNQAQSEANVVNQAFRIPESRLKDYLKDLREVAFKYTRKHFIEENGGES